MLYLFFFFGNKIFNAEAKASNCVMTRVNDDNDDDVQKYSL